MGLFHPLLPSDSLLYPKVITKTIHCNFSTLFPFAKVSSVHCPGADLHKVHPVVRRSFVRCLSPCPKYLISPYNAIFLKSQRSKDIKNDILDCQIHKYTNTNTQIHKYTNTAYDKMTEIPNICYIFEQLVVQGCQK